MILSTENYYSREANTEYMSVSQFKDFDRCPAAALAELRGEYAPAASPAMLVGGYVDAWFSGELPLFQAQHPEIFRRDGTLKSEYCKAQDIIARMEADELFSLLMSGAKQVIVTGEIAGVPFKGKVDSLLDAAACREIVRRFPETEAVLGALPRGAIVDQKVMRDLGPVWSQEEGRKLPFVEAYGYDIQGAVYRALEGHNLPVVLAVGTKENEPDLAALSVSDADLTSALYQVEDRAPYYQKIKLGEIKPRRCERCDYCRRTRRLTSILDYRELVEDDG